MPFVERRSIHKGNVIFIFVDNCGWELSRDDFTENAKFRRDTGGVSDFQLYCIQFTLNTRDFPYSNNRNCAVEHDELVVSGKITYVVYVYY